MKATPSTFLRSSDPIEIFMSADRNVRFDLILSHPEVVGWIYVEDGILWKTFLPTKITNFRDKLKTSVVAIYGSCSASTPVKVNHRYLFSDTFRFSSGDLHDLFPSVTDGNFLQTAHRANPDTYPDFLGDLDYNDCLMLSVLFCFPLFAGTIIKEVPVTNKGVVELPAHHHPIVGE